MQWKKDKLMKHQKLTIKQKRILKNILVVVLLIISFPSYTPTQVIIKSDHILISNHLLSRPIECSSFDGLTYTGLDGKKYSHKNYVGVQPLTISNTITFSTSKTLYSAPFSYYATSNTVPAGSYHVTKEAGRYMYIEGKGWVSSQYVSIDVNNSIENTTGIPLYKNYMIPETSSHRTHYAMRPLYITIHTTDNTSKGADALSHAKLQYTGNVRSASWHYTVDNHSIYQSLPLNQQAGHAGDGVMPGNSASIAIEICVNSDGHLYMAEKNAAKLATALLKQYNLSVDQLRMHHDWSGKECPRPMIEGQSGSMNWESFKKQVYNYLRTV